MICCATLGLIEELNGSASVDISTDVCEKLMIELVNLQNSQLPKDSSVAVAVHESGIRLWNLVIAKKVSKKMNKLSIAQGTIIIFLIYLDYLEITCNQITYNHYIQLSV